MSDFDTVLERLIADPRFKAHFAADPASALAGYELAPDERELLLSQYAAGSGGQRQVEQRTSKASLFGVLSPLSGMGSSVADAAHGGGSGTDVGHFSSTSYTSYHSSSSSYSSGSAHGYGSVGNYHARVDVQGDGKWDAHTYSARADGGIDINVDLNHDGRADFVGVDHDRDGLIDESYMDFNHDGKMDAHYVDTNHDGWLD